MRARVHPQLQIGFVFSPRFLKSALEEYRQAAQENLQHLLWVENFFEKPEVFSHLQSKLPRSLIRLYRGLIRFSVAFFPDGISLTYSLGKVFGISVLCRLGTSLRPQFLGLLVSRCTCESCTYNILKQGTWLVFLQTKIFNFGYVPVLYLYSVQVQLIQIQSADTTPVISYSDFLQRCVAVQSVMINQQHT